MPNLSVNLICFLALIRVFIPYFQFSTHLFRDIYFWDIQTNLYVLNIEAFNRRSRPRNKLLNIYIFPLSRDHIYLKIYSNTSN